MPNIKPGDKVLVTQDGYSPFPNGELLGDDVYGIIATKGSLGIVVPFEEYKAFIWSLPHGYCNPAHVAGMIKLTEDHVKLGEEYPIRFTKVAPLDASRVVNPFGDNDEFLGVGRIEPLPPDCFLVISDEEYEAFLQI